MLLVLASDREDPVEILTWAAESYSRGERVAGYRRALAVAGSPSATYDAWYMASARARALAGLARDGEVGAAEAEAAAREAVALGEACASLLAVAEMHFSFRDFDATRRTIMSVPRTCFGSELLFLWRFRLWDLRARSCFELGRRSEGFRYAERLVARMDRASDPFDLELLPPYGTTRALIDMADGSERAREILARMHATADLPDWFPPDMVQAVARAAGQPGA